ncbi:hypothetical protein MHA01_13810 [Marinococcus halophilus]|uniref:Uncharacterized protein n=1 Tax=Marinococcus halophilus TaxID=1371 RepID=A0A510Y530_MARHA|nr:hypothetical protein MHA01_13810 [Marinococcus halophilus]
MTEPVPFVGTGFLYGLTMEIMEWKNKDERRAYVFVQTSRRLFSGGRGLSLFTWQKEKRNGVLHPGG